MWTPWYKPTKGVFIYNGFLEESILSKDGGIDRIYLSDVRRRLMKDDIHEEKKDRYYRLPGKFLSCHMSTLLICTSYIIALKTLALKALWLTSPPADFHSKYMNTRAVVELPSVPNS